MRLRQCYYDVTINGPDEIRTHENQLRRLVPYLPCPILVSQGGIQARRQVRAYCYVLKRVLLNIFAFLEALCLFRTPSNTSPKTLWWKSFRSCLNRKKARIVTGN